MERFFSSVDKWLIDYLVYKYVTYYTMDPFKPEKESLLAPISRELLHLAIEQAPPHHKKVHLLLLAFTMEEVERICDGGWPFVSNDDGNIESLRVISEEERDSLFTYLLDMQGSLRMFSECMEREATRALARKCLMDCLVMNYQLRLKFGNDEEDALETLRNTVMETDSTEEREAYQHCRDLKPVSGKYLAVSEFAAHMKELIAAINSCFEIPHLVLFAMAEDKSSLDDMLQDQRPSKKADVMDVMAGCQLGEDRKLELCQLVEGTNLDSSDDDEQEIPKLDEGDENMNASSSNANPGPSRRLFSPHLARRRSTYMFKLGRKIKEYDPLSMRHRLRQIDMKMTKVKKSVRPPSHCRVRLGPWLPEEETVFIEETLKCGVGNWAQIKQKIKSARSSQQLKDKWRNIKPHVVKETAKRLGIKRW